MPESLRQIVGRCLQREPEDRYPTAKALAEDPKRFLAGQPTLARPPSRSAENPATRAAESRGPDCLWDSRGLAVTVLVGGRLTGTRVGSKVPPDASLSGKIPRLRRGKPRKRTMSAT